MGDPRPGTASGSTHILQRGAGQAEQLSSFGRNLHLPAPGWSSMTVLPHRSSLGGGLSSSVQQPSPPEELGMGLSLHGIT